MLQQMGAQIDGVGTLDADHRGRRPALADDPRHRPGPHRRRHLGVRRRDDPGRRHRAAARVPSTSRSRWTSWSGRRRGRRRAPTTGSGCVMDRRPTAVDAVTLPYPGLATDLQPMVMALNSIADGAAMITENIFEGRFVFASELARLGARRPHRRAPRRRPRACRGCPARRCAASDIRAGAALALAGLVAEGVTHVSDIYHVDRGYPGFDERAARPRRRRHPRARPGRRVRPTAEARRVRSRPSSRRAAVSCSRNTISRGPSVGR